MQGSEEGDRGMTGDTGDERRRRREEKRERVWNARKCKESGPQISPMTQIRKKIESRLAPIPEPPICGIREICG
jgi:hypothetical protein